MGDRFQHGSEHRVMRRFSDREVELDPALDIFAGARMRALVGHFAQPLQVAVCRSLRRQ